MRNDFGEQNIRYLENLLLDAGESSIYPAISVRARRYLWLFLPEVSEKYLFTGQCQGRILEIDGRPEVPLVFVVWHMRHWVRSIYKEILKLGVRGICVCRD